MKTKTIWIVWANTDTTEGRGQTFPMYHCETEATAIRLAKGVGVMGGDGEVAPCEVIEHGGRFLAPFLMKSATPADLQRQKELDAKNAAIKRAQKLGLTDLEISNLRL